MFTRLLPALFFAVACASCAAPGNQLSAKLDGQSKQIGDLQVSLRALQSDVANKGGRFQIINGTPQFARNIMLVDTQTGRAWVVCETKDALRTTNTNWCAMDFVGKAATPD